MASAFEDLLDYLEDLKGSARQHHENILSLIWAPGWANQVRVGSYDPDIVPSHVVSEGVQLYIRDQFMKTNRNFVSTFDASEGTLYLLFVVSLLLHPSTPNTFGLDNVDGTLNPELVRKLTQTMVAACTATNGSESRFAYQTFMTSHHPSSLDSFDIFEDDQRIFIAQRKKQGVAVGSTTLERLQAPSGMTKGDWVDVTEGRKLSVFLLEDKIPGALS